MSVGKPGQILDRVIARFGLPKETKRFFKFATVGISGSVIDFGLLNLLIFGMGWQADFDKLLANIVSVSCAIINNYTWNRLWTFQEARDERKRTQLIKFIVVSLTGLFINSLIFYGSYQLVFEALFGETWAVQVSKASAIFVVLFWNFTLNRLWTFRTMPPPQEEAKPQPPTEL